MKGEAQNLKINEQRTHKLASRRLVGIPVSIEEGKAEVMLRANEEMVVDDYGLIHGGFTFGLADYAAMLAVNEPNVVLWKADVTFTRPVKLGEEMRARAEVKMSEGKKRIVDVEVETCRGIVFKGRFVCYVPETHVLQRGDEA